MMRLAAIAFCLFFIFSTAWAYYPHPGDRAAEISGRDMLTGRQVDLDSLRGKWVLVEFTQPG